MTTSKHRCNLIVKMTLLFISLFTFNVLADSHSENWHSYDNQVFIDKLKSVSVEGITINDVKIADKKVRITGSAIDNKTIAQYMRTLDSEVGSPNLELIKREKQGDRQASNFAITIKKPRV